MEYTYYLKSDLTGEQLTQDHTFNKVHKMQEHISSLIRSSTHLTILDVKYKNTQTSVKNYNLRLKQYYGH